MKRTRLTVIVTLLTMYASLAVAQTDITPVDYTDRIINPSFEDGLAGWTNNGMQTQNNNEVNANKTGRLYCEKWTPSPNALSDADVQQTVTGLQDGIYRITAMCHAELQNRKQTTITGTFLFAGENTVKIGETRDYEVTGTAIGGELTIGFKTEKTNANWVTVDNFRLEWMGAPEDGYRNLLDFWTGKLQTLIATKKILSDEQKQEAQNMMDEAGKTTSETERMAAIKTIKAKYEELQVYRIPVDYSDEAGKYKGYLFTFFPSNNNENLYYAYSDDGFNYTVLNNGQRVMASDTVAIKRGIRDPHILRGADGKTFYMVATDMRSAEGWASNRGIVMYKSTDMVHWQHNTVHFPTRFPNGWSSVTRVWAPEVIWDENYENTDGTKGRYLVYFSLLTSDDGTCTYDKVYYCYANDDFTDLLDYPQHFYDRGSSTIDADIVFDESDRLYHMIYKNEGAGGIAHVTAETLTPAEGQPSGSQWSAPTGSVQQTNVAVEGGGIFRLIGKDTWVVMYDCYGSGYYEFCTTKDWETYTLVARTTTSGAFTPRHGTVIPITTREYNTLLRAFPTDGLELEEESIPVTGIELPATSISLEKGETYIIEAKVLPENASDKTLRWESNYPEIATVDNNGKVTAVDAGECLITVTDGTGLVKAECVITVNIADDINAIFNDTKDIQSFIKTQDDVKVYTPDGRLVYNGHGRNMPALHGLFIIEIPGKKVRIVL